MTDLIVFADADHAHKAGFSPVAGRRLRSDPNLMAWWPSQGEEVLRGAEYARVFFTEGAHRAVARMSSAEHEKFRAALHTIYSHLRLEPMVSMEL